MVCDEYNCYFSFWAIFALLPSPPPEKSKFQKNEKMSGDNIILHLRTKNYD